MMTRVNSFNYRITSPVKRGTRFLNLSLGCALSLFPFTLSSHNQRTLLPAFAISECPTATEHINSWHEEWDVDTTASSCMDPPPQNLSRSIRGTKNGW